MDKQYEQYCLTSPDFYDLPYRNNATAEYFPVARQPLPPGWRRERLGDWLINIPPGPPIPPQGWKIHVSACLDNASEIVTQVWQYCVPRNISFKFLPGRLAVLMRNAKYAPRGSSGKVITIYPSDEAACERILAELDAVLDGAPGPYILSDLRYGDGPLHVRYGGFTESSPRSSSRDSRSIPVTPIATRSRRPSPIRRRSLPTRPGRCGSAAPSSGPPT